MSGLGEDEILYEIFSHPEKAMRFKDIMEFCGCDPRGKKRQYAKSIAYGTMLSRLRSLRQRGDLEKKTVIPEKGRTQVFYQVPHDKWPEVKKKADMAGLLRESSNDLLKTLETLIRKNIEIVVDKTTDATLHQVKTFLTSKGYSDLANDEALLTIRPKFDFKIVF
jgi:hypothetical protein